MAALLITKSSNPCFAKPTTNHWNHHFQPQQSSIETCHSNSAIHNQSHKFHHVLQFTPRSNWLALSELKPNRGFHSQQSTIVICTQARIHPWCRRAFIPLPSLYSSTQSLCCSTSAPASSQSRARAAPQSSAAVAAHLFIQSPSRIHQSCCNHRRRRT
jgi:hypothetical protein